MRSPPKPATTSLDRLILGRRLDRNPLRRPTDRIETVVLLTLLAAFLAGAPLAARAVADWTYGRSLRVEQSEQATFRQVPAVLLQAPDISRFTEAAGMSMTEVRWTAQNGQPRTGSAPAPLTAAAGSTMLVWIDADGNLSNPPMLPSEVSAGAGLSGAAAVPAGWRGYPAALVSAGCSTRATTRLAMKRAVRTAVPVRVTSLTSTTPRPVLTSTRRPARVAATS
jgi:hypothetical protein